MTIPYSSGKSLSIDQLTNVNITDIANNNLLQYSTTTGEWTNGNDINLDEIDCRVLRVSETADIVGRLANQGVASFVNDEFIFQNGVSNLGDTLYIDNQNNRVGINIANPEEDLEVDGSIQIDSATVARLKYQKSGTDPHALGEIDGKEDGTNGGDLEFFTKVDGGSVSEKLRINNIGAIGIGGPTYGSAGAVLTSNGTDSSVSWDRPYFMVAGLETNYVETGASNTKIVNDMEERFNGSNYNFGNWNETDDSWDCPADGFYKITGTVRGSSETTNLLFRLNAILTRYNSTNVEVGDVAFSGLDLHTDTADEADLISATAISIIYITQGEKIKLRANWETNSDLLEISGLVGGAETTYLMVERIVKGTY